MGSESGRQFGRPYCEAFPSIQLSSSHRKALLGYPVAQWSNEDGLVVGNAFLRYGEQQLLIQYRFFGTTNIPRHEGRQMVELGWRADRIQGGRLVFVCFSCLRHAEKIFYVREHWACRRCHRLVHLSTRVSTLTRRWDEFRQLKRTLTYGRPRYMRKAHYEDLRNRLAVLQRELKGTEEPELHSQLRYRLEEKWFMVDDQRVKLEADEGTCGWSRLDTNGFSGPYGFDFDFDCPDPLKAGGKLRAEAAVQQENERKASPHRFGHIDIGAANAPLSRDGWP